MTSLTVAATLPCVAPTGTDDRIDQRWVFGPLADAVVSYRLLTEPLGASPSDQRSLVVAQSGVFQVE